MASIAQISSSLCSYSSSRDICLLPAAKFAAAPRLPLKFGTAFATGSPLLIKATLYRRSSVSNSTSVAIRCEQNTDEGNGVDVWIGRLAMVGFAAVISVEVGTGKGLLENFGLTSPLPSVALVVTALVGVLTAVLIFQSASKT